MLKWIKYSSLKKLLKTDELEKILAWEVDRADLINAQIKYHDYKRNLWYIISSLNTISESYSMRSRLSELKQMMSPQGYKKGVQWLLDLENLEN